METTNQNSSHWYAIYTRPRWEKKVASLLLQKKVAHYCPLNTELRQWKDRKKLVEEPVFRSYVFVHINSDEKVKVLQTDGVISFVTRMNKPAVIRDEEIAIVKQYLQAYGKVSVEVVDYAVSDTIRVVDGPLIACEGSVVSVGKQKLRVYLHSLQYVMTVEIDKDQVQLVQQEHQNVISHQTFTNNTKAL